MRKKSWAQSFDNGEVEGLRGELMRSIIAKCLVFGIYIYSEEGDLHKMRELRFGGGVHSISWSRRCGGRPIERSALTIGAERKSQNCRLWDWRRSQLLDWAPNNRSSVRQDVYSLFTLVELHIIMNRTRAIVVLKWLEKAEASIHYSTRSLPSLTALRQTKPAELALMSKSFSLLQHFRI